MEILSGRQILILQYLYQSNEALSSEFLSTSIGVSSKTIKKDVVGISKALKHYGAYIEAKTGIGFLLKIEDIELFLVYFNSFSENNFQSDALPLAHQRAHYIIRFILSSFSPVTVNDLATNLHTSRTTISNDLLLVAKILTAYDIVLINKPHHGLIYIAKENNIRYCLVDEYNHYKNNSLFINEDCYFDLFNSNTEAIQDIIFKQLQTRSSLEISFQHHYLIIRIIQLCEKRKNYSTEYMFNDKIIQRIKSSNSFAIAQEILKLYGDLTKHSFSENDVYILSVYITCYRNYSSYENVDNKDNYFTHFRLSEEIINFLCNNNNFTALRSDATFKSTLALHLMPLTNRLTYGLQINNTSSSRKDSISSVELAAQTAYYLKEYKNMMLSENEIVYLSSVFKPIFARYNRILKKKSLIIVTGIDNNAALILKERFWRNFSDYIKNIDFANYYNLKNKPLKNYDFLITDIKLDSLPHVPIPVLTLDCFFSQSKKVAIQNILSVKNLNFNHFLEMFKKEMFFNYTKVNTKEDFFEQFFVNTNKVIPLTSIFKDDLVTRASLCNIERSNYTALMKTLHQYNFSSFISVNILDKPILWDFQKIQIIIIIHINRMDSDLAEYFENGYFSKILKSIFFNHENMSKLVKFRDYDVLFDLVKEKTNYTFLSNHNK